ncbi:ABC transporter ATP-binding protein [Halobacteriales archaeon QH_2_65_14]|nr:MAG: ABC transporter ATP-binding protein [Halobacteriales archaeon QH_2_65_14]
MTEPAIETTGLTKRFGGDVLAVDGLDMTVERGEVYGFLGPNGAGKSTTINMLLDFIHPTEGSARVLGYDTREESLEIRKRVGVLPEGAELYPRLSGREHVEFVGDVKDVDVDPEAMLDRMGLAPEDQTRNVDGYSKGMQQRLALGMALAGDPELLILDEPSSGLDPNGMAEMREIILDEAGDGTTVFFSSHLLEQVEAVCNRVAILHQGRLVAEDTIEGLRDVSGVNPVVELQCAEPPEDDLGIGSLDGVLSVETDGRWLEVTCRDPADKITAIRRADGPAELTDVVAEETSLEALFESYTGERESGDGAVEERQPAATEVNR